MTHYISDWYLWWLHAPDYVYLLWVVAWLIGGMLFEVVRRIVINTVRQVRRKEQVRVEAHLTETSTLRPVPSPE